MYSLFSLYSHTHLSGHASRENVVDTGVLLRELEASYTGTRGEEAGAGPFSQDGSPVAGKSAILITCAAVHCATTQPRGCRPTNDPLRFTDRQYILPRFAAISAISPMLTPAAVAPKQFQPSPKLTTRVKLA